MRTCLTLAALLALVLAGCGDAPKPTGPVGEWVISKPNPIVGELRGAVLERPAVGVARVGVEWRALPGARNCALEIILPEGGELLEGTATVPLHPDALSGEQAWLVSFPTDRTLDATLRLCADTEDGMRACEVAVRLVTVAR